MSNPDLDDRERRRMQDVLEQARKLVEGAGFDAAIIMATYQTEEGDTACVHANAGNWYAQLGMATSLITRRKEQDALEQRQKEEED